MTITLVKKFAHDPLMTRDEAAKFLGVSGRSLDRWHAIRQGPDRIKVGPKRIAYRRSALEAWLEAGTERGTMRA